MFFPRYLWRKNGEPLESLGVEIYQVPGAGTITIKTPTAVHEGVYQCFASNEWGTALSVKTLLRKAGTSSIIHSLNYCKSYCFSNGESFAGRQGPDSQRNILNFVFKLL